MRTFKKFLALILALLMLVGTGVGVVSSSAAEVEGNYNYALNYLSALDVLKGYGDGDNGENDKILRYQMALLFVRAITGETDDAMWKDGDATFTDLKGYAGSVAGAIAFAEGMGIIEGYGNGKFGPNDGIKYQDALVMMIRALGYEEEGMVYPYGYIQKAIKLNLHKNIVGVGYGDTLTRGETAQLIYNMMFVKLAGTSGKAEAGNSFISANFKTSDKQMILVATNNVKDEIENLNVTVDTPEKENAVVFQDAYSGEIVSLKADASMVSIPAGHSIDEFVGYGFTVIYDENDEVIGAEINAYESYENLGNDVVVFKPGKVNGNTVLDPSIIDVNGDLYQMVNEITDDEDRNYNQIVVYEYTNDPDNMLVPLGTDIVALYPGLTLRTNLYSYAKLTLIDTDSDGIYDRAIHKPYNIGIYGVKVALDEATGEETEFAMVKNYVSNALGWRFLSNANAATLTDSEFENQDYVVSAVDGVSTCEASKLDNIKVDGTLNNGEVIIYEYDVITNSIRVIFSAPILEGRLGMVKNYHLNISGKQYYAGLYANINGHPDSTGGDNIFAAYYSSSTSPKAHYDTSISKANGYSAILDADQPNVKYAIIQNKIAYFEDYLPTEEGASDDYNFVVIDNAWAGNYDYTKNESAITLDENNNILVYAITENGGKPQQIKVSKIVSTAGVEGGKLANADIVFGELDNIYGETLFKNELTGQILPATAANISALFNGNYIYTVVSEEAGEYILNVDLAYAENRNAVRVEALSTMTLKFRNGISGAALVANREIADYGFAAGRIILDNNSTVVLVGADGVVYYNGIPENVTFINLKATDALYNAEKDLIVIKTNENVVADNTTYYGVDDDGDLNAGAVYGTWAGTDVGLVASDDTVAFVAISGSVYSDSEYVGNDESGNIIIAHTYTGLLNLATLEVEDVVIKTGSVTAPVALNQGDVITVETAADGTQTVTDNGSNAPALYAVACVLGYNFGYITEVGDTMAIHIEGDTGLEARPGVTNDSVEHGSDETALFGGYTIHVIYDRLDNSELVYGVVNSDEDNLVFDANTSYACAYMYDEEADSVVAYVIVN